MTSILLCFSGNHLYYVGIDHVFPLHHYIDRTLYAVYRSVAFFLWNGVLGESRLGTYLYRESAHRLLQKYSSQDRDNSGWCAYNNVMTFVFFCVFSSMSSSSQCTLAYKYDAAAFWGSQKLSVYTLSKCQPMSRMGYSCLGILIFLPCNHGRHCGWTWGRQQVLSSAEIVTRVFSCSQNNQFKTFDSHKQTAKKWTRNVSLLPVRHWLVDNDERHSRVFLGCACLCARSPMADRTTTSTWYLNA